MRLRRESEKRPVERPRREPPPEVANVGFELLQTVAQSRGYAITNVDSLGVIERFTFAEIMRETAQWAQLLREKGLRPGDRVVIVTGREWGWRCALLGAMRAGGVAVPCPASLPLREIGAVAAHSGASLLVALRPRPDLVELEGHVALTADDLDTVDPSQALRQPPHPTEARDIALILYTWRGLDLSGTMHTHASLLAQADAGEHWLGVGADERIWATADDGSGPSIWLLLAGWRRAASVVVVDLELDSDAKLELLDRLRPAAVWFSDDEYRVLGSADVPPWVDLSSIRRAFVDTDETEGATAFSAAFGAALVPVFTLDELGVVAGWPNGRESRAEARTAQPAPGVQLAVVGEDGTELPPGEVGDVVVRGDAPTLFTGYAGKEGRSRSAGWFRFGWRGTLTADGALRLESRAPSEVLPAESSAEAPALEVAEAPPSEAPAAVQEDEVEDVRVEEDAAREQAEREAAAAKAHAAEEERLQAEQAATALAAAEADQRRRAEEAERVEATRRMEEEKRRDEERQREEKAAKARADEEAKAREKAEAEERRRADEDAKTQARIAAEEAKQRTSDEKERERREAEAAREQAKIAAAEAKQRDKDEKEREKREAVERAEREKAAAEAAKVQAKVDAAEAKQRTKDEKEREKREAVERAEREKAAAEAAKVQAKVDAAEAKQRARDEKEREKREAIERAEREKAAAEAAKVQAKVDAAEAKQRAKDEKEREKREAVERAEREKAEAEAAKAQQKQAEVEAKQRAEEDKRRAKEREREEKEARRRADQEAKEAARAERKPAFGRRRQEVPEEPEREPEHVPDVVARIQQYGMAGASTERPAEPPEQSEDE